MLNVARMNDMTFGTCHNHKHSRSEYGYLIPTQMKVLVNGLPVIRMFDTAITNGGCGTGTMMSGSVKVFVIGQPMCRITDSFVATGGYEGIVIGGSNNVYCA
jgi:uncharacterized Zn-binding protein involved in type VI secretion